MVFYEDLSSDMYETYYGPFKVYFVKIFIKIE